MPKDVVVGLVMLLVAVLFWLGADAIPKSPLDDATVGADGLPKALAVALGALAAIMTLRAAAPALLGSGRPAPEEPAAGLSPMRRHLRALGMLGLGAAYLLAIPYLGYALAIGLLMLATALYNGGRLTPTLAAIAAAGAGVFYLIFVRLLDIPLPAGFWPVLFG